MKDTPIPPNIQRMLDKYEKAIREHELMGSQHPEDQESIQICYDAEKLKIKRMIQSLLVHTH